LSTLIIINHKLSSYIFKKIAKKVAEMAFKYSLGLNEFASKAPTNLWRSIIAEFVGIFILNFFSCAACSQSKGDFVLISLAFGLSVFAAASVSYQKQI
jgi:glycerol uptake facilitator-like aquaporin